MTSAAVQHYQMPQAIPNTYLHDDIDMLMHITMPAKYGCGYTTDRM